MQEILPQSPLSSKHQFDPFIASDEQLAEMHADPHLVVWLDSVRAQYEAEDRQIAEQCDREREEFERNPWGDE